MQTNVHIPLKSALREYVTAIWEVKGKQNCKETVLPNGIVEIIFNFADAVHGILPVSKLETKAPRCFIQGVNTDVLQASYVGQHHLMGIRLRPHRVRELLGILPTDLLNTNIDLALIKPKFLELWHALISLDSFAKRVALLETHLPALPQATCNRIEKLCDLFSSDDVESFQSVDELAQQVCYSPRQLSRISHDLFGLSAEELTGYKKYVQATKLMHIEGKSLTDIAHLTGFYDQSHFCRVFKSYAGMTPKQYKNAKGENPFHIIS